MKKYLDKIILFAFYVLCLISFFLLVNELPNLLNDLFNTSMFEGSQTLSFVFCIFVLFYFINYYNNKISKAKAKQCTLYNNKLLALNNIRTLHFSNLKSILNIELTPFFDVYLILSNSYTVNLQLQYFACIDRQEKLLRFDNYVTEYIEKNIDTMQEKNFNEIRMEKDFTDYLINFENN